LEYSNIGTKNKDAGINTLEIFGTERLIKFQLSNSLKGERERRMKAWFLVPQISDVSSCAKAILRS